MKYYELRCKFVTHDAISIEENNEMFHEFEKSARLIVAAIGLENASFFSPELVLTHDSEYGVGDKTWRKTDVV